MSDIVALKLADVYLKKVRKMPANLFWISADDWAVLEHRFAHLGIVANRQWDYDTLFHMLAYADRLRAQDACLPT